MVRISLAVSFFLGGVAVPSPSPAQQYIISTFAGVANQSANQTFLGFGVTTDPAGRVYFTSNTYCVCVFKLDRTGFAIRIAGNSEPGFSGDGGPAANSQLNRPGAIAADTAGNLFVVDAGNNRVRKISPEAIISTFAGNGEVGYSGDGGPAADAPIPSPTAVAVDPSGNLYVADSYSLNGIHSHIRKVAPDGIISTVAGNGVPSVPGDGGPAIDASVGPVSGLAIDGDGNLLIADYNRVRKVSADGMITTVAGTGHSGSNFDCSAGLSGDGGPATLAPLRIAAGVAVDTAGDVFITEMGLAQGDYTTVALRKVSRDGTISTLLGDNVLYWGGQLATDLTGNLFIADGSRVLEVTPQGIISTVAGFGACCYSGDGGPATEAEFNLPRGVGVDDAGELFILDSYNHRIRKVSADGVISTAAGAADVTVHCLDLTGDSGPASSAQLCFPYNIAVDGKGNLFISDGYRVRKVSPDGVITVAAGNGTPGFSGDGGSAPAAQLSVPLAVAVDESGNLFIHDLFRIRKVSSAGIITTVAGSGAYGYSGDGGPALEAQITAGASSLAVDGAGNLFFLDSGRVRKVSAEGVITTVAGGGKNPDADGVPATSVQLSAAVGLAVDGAGNLFLAAGPRVRKISPDGIITTIAGTGTSGYTSDYGLATDAQLYASALTVDKVGNIYVTDSLSNVVRGLRPR